MRRGFMNMFPGVGFDPAQNPTYKNSISGCVGNPEDSPEKKAEQPKAQFSKSVFANLDTNKNEKVSGKVEEGASLFSHANLNQVAINPDIDPSKKLNQADMKKIQSMALEKFDVAANFQKIINKMDVDYKMQETKKYDTEAEAQAEANKLAQTINSQVRSDAQKFTEQINKELFEGYTKALNSAYKDYKPDDTNVSGDKLNQLNGVDNSKGTDADNTASNTNVVKTYSDGTATTTIETPAGKDKDGNQTAGKAETKIYSSFDKNTDKHVKGADSEVTRFNQTVTLDNVAPRNLNSLGEEGQRQLSDVKKMVANNFNPTQMFNQALQSFDFKSGMQTIKHDANKDVSSEVSSKQGAMNNNVRQAMDKAAAKANNQIKAKLEKAYDAAFKQYVTNGNKLPDGFKENPIPDAPPAAKGKEPQLKAKADDKDRANISIVKNAGGTKSPGKGTPADQVDKKTGLFSKNKAQDDKVMAALIDTLGNVAIAGVGGQQTSSEGVSASDAAAVQNEMKTRFAGKTPEQILWMNLNAKGLENIDQSTFKKIEGDFIAMNEKAGVFVRDENGKCEVRQDKLTEVRLFKMDASELRKKYSINA